MSVDPRSVIFLNTVIKPTLSVLGMPDPHSASMLLLGTAVHESLNFRYRKQVHGPARGYFQMESPTFDDTWDRGVAGHPHRLSVVKGMVSGHAPIFADMETNDQFATAMARVKYLLAPAKMPQVAGPWPTAVELTGLAHYWKRYYNTVKGKGTESQFISDWHRYIHS